MKIGIVQISDIHNSNKDKFQKVAELKKVLNAHYLAYCDSVFLVMNGDMAFSGMKEEYNESELQLLEIKETIENKLSKTCDIYCVPGNHDCNFYKNSRGREQLVAGIQNKSIEIDDQIIKEVMLQEEYNDFEDVFNSDWQYSTLNKNNYLGKNISYLDSEGDIVVNINLLNTAWISELKEKPAQMFFPCSYAEDILDYIPNCLNITVMHHPSNWLDPDNKREFDKLIMENTDVLLTGHEHGNEENNLNGIHIFEGGVLNESGNSNLSSFRVIVYETETKNIQVTDFQWNKNEKIYTEQERTRSYPIIIKDGVNLKRSLNSFTFSVDQDTYINGLEDPFFHPSKGTLSLKDIFVWPNFKNKKLGSDKFLNVSGETFKKRLIDNNPSYWLIYSPRKYGKTSLAKSVSEYLLKKGFIPVLQNGRDIKKRHINDTSKFLKDIIKSHFSGLSWDKFTQEEMKYKYLIIDNWDSLEVNESGKDKLLENLQYFFGHIIILTSDPNVSLEEVFKANEYIVKGMEEFKLREVNSTNLEEFVENWINKENDFDIGKEELSLKLEEYTNVLGSVFKTATVPKVPLYINIILQALVNNQTYDFKSKGSAYFYEVLVKQTLMNIQTNESSISTLDTYLSELSFRMFTLGKGLSYDEWNQFHVTHLNSYDMRPQDFKFETVKKELLKHEIFSQTDGLYHFNHDYLYYYFIAHYLVDNIDDDDKIKETFSEVIQNIDRDENTNILWFITHFKRNNYIIDELKETAKNLLKETANLTLDEDIEVFNKLMENVPNLVYEEANVKENRRKRNEMKDYLEDEYDDTSNSTSKKDENVKDYRQRPEIIEYIKARQLSDALGNILKNYSGSLKKDVKEELAHTALNLSLRSHSELMSRFSSNTENLINLFSEMLLQTGKRTKEDSIKKSKEFIFSFVNALCFSMIKTSVNEISTRNLLNAFERIINDDESTTALSLISYGVFLDNNIFDEKLIESMQTKYVNLEDNNFSRATLRFLIIQQLLYVEMSPSKKQKICHLFNIDYRDAIKVKQRAALDNT